MSTNYRVTRRPHGALHVWFGPDVTDADIRNATTELHAQLNGDRETLILEIGNDSGTLDRSHARIWSDALAPARHRFAVTRIVGVKSAITRMVIAAFALADRQRVEFVERLEDADRPHA